MVTFPPEFVATRYPGYFWHSVEKRLYTMKVTGVLRPLAYAKPNVFNKGFGGYRVSIEGEKRYMREEYLLRLKPKKQTVPVQLSLL